LNSVQKIRFWRNEMKKQVSTTKAPAAIGPYSQGVVSTETKTVYVSGQLPIDPATGTMPEDVAAQTRQSLLNLKAILEEAGSSMENVLKTNVYLKDMNEFAKMNAVYAEFFTEPFPARAAVEVARLPKDALVEIEAVAITK
jgi:2-iminobutanoate/2-iminopropanoate deaminase